VVILVVLALEREDQRVDVFNADSYRAFGIGFEYFAQAVDHGPIPLSLPSL